MSNPRILYSESHPAVILRAALGGSAMVMLAVAAFLPADLQVRLVIMCAALAELILLFALRTLTIEVRTDALELRFGPGWIRRTYAIGQIASAEFREWSWRRGAGVRVGFTGSIYLVARGDVVELRLQSGRRIFFSAADARRVLRALGETGVPVIGA